MSESWKDIDGYEGVYQISDLGRVKSLARTNSIGKRLKEKILKGHVNKKGYCVASLHNASGIRTVKIHRIVASSFLKNPESKRTVNHIDGCKENNKLDNLEWATHQENIDHAIEMRLMPNGNPVRGVNHGRAKLTELYVFEIFSLRNKGWIQRDIAEAFGVSRHTISDVLLRKSWKHLDTQ